VWIKFSTPYRCSNLGHTYADLETLVRRFVQTNPDRVVWGSDWPHTQRHKDRIEKNPEALEPFLEIDNKA
jgi:predicted TIM-barrel fold metal-dependent hydrolase